MNTKKILPTLALALALSGATTLAPADAAPDHHVRPAEAGSFKVTASVNKDEVIKGDKVKIKGAVTPAAPGAQVSLLVRYADRKEWKTIGHTTLRADSTFTFKDEAGSVRVRKYRVVKPAGPTRGAGHSSRLKVTVFGWRNLDAMTTLPGATTVLGGSATINATTYPHSLRATSGPAHIDFNLNRDCKALDAVYGVDDSSPLGASAVLSVVADGATRHSAAYSLTQAQRVVTDLSGVFRLSLSSSGSGGAYPAVGTPKVLCSF